MPRSSSESSSSGALRTVRRLKRQVALTHERPVQEMAAQMKALLAIEDALKEGRFTVEVANRIWKTAQPTNRPPRIPRGEVDMHQEETAKLYAQLVEASRQLDERAHEAQSRCGPGASRRRVEQPSRAAARLREFWKKRPVVPEVLVRLKAVAPAWLDAEYPPLGLSRESCVTLLDTFAVRHRQRLSLTRFRVLALLVVFADDMDDSTAERHATRWRREETRRAEEARAQAAARKQRANQPEVVVALDEPAPRQDRGTTPRESVRT